MKRKWLFTSFAAIVLIACMSYETVRFVRVMDRPVLNIPRGSASEAASRRSGFYLGVYTPTRRIIGLKDNLSVHVPDAWVEHAWKPELTTRLQDRQESTSGYYLYIPIHPNETIGSGKAWPFKFALQLEQQAQQISQRPGIGYDDAHGFFVFLDGLPNTIKFTVVQKRNESDSWNNATPVESIEFRRAF